VSRRIRIDVDDAYFNDPNLEVVLVKDGVATLLRGVVARRAKVVPESGKRDRLVVEFVVESATEVDIRDPEFRGPRAGQHVHEFFREVLEHGRGAPDPFNPFHGLFDHLRPQAPPAMWSTLLERPRDLEEAEANYKRLAKTHHPDVGGDAETMKALNRAIVSARKYFARR